MIFKDKTVIVTGGSEGVGAAAARLFAQAGANLMLVARNRKNLEAIAAELRDKTRVEIFPMDVSDAGSCVDLLKKTLFEFGRIDVLVNNASVLAPERSTTLDGYELTLATNLLSTFLLTNLLSTDGFMQQLEGFHYGAPLVPIVVVSAIVVIVEARAQSQSIVPACGHPAKNRIRRRRSRHSHLPGSNLRPSGQSVRAACLRP